MKLLSETIIVYIENSATKLKYTDLSHISSSVQRCVCACVGMR